MNAVVLRREVDRNQIWQHLGVSSRRLRRSLALGVLPSVHFLVRGRGQR